MEVGREAGGGKRPFGGRQVRARGPDEDGAGGQPEQEEGLRTGLVLTVDDDDVERVGGGREDVRDPPEGEDPGGDVGEGDGGRPGPGAGVGGAGRVELLLGGGQLGAGAVGGGRGGTGAARPRPGVVPAAGAGLPRLVAVRGDHEVGEVGVDGADAGEQLVAADLEGALVAGLGEGAEGAAVGGGVAGVDGLDGGGQFGGIVGAGGGYRVAEGVEVGSGAVDAETFEGVAEVGGVGVPLDRVLQDDGEAVALQEAARRVDGAHGLADAGEAGVGADEPGDAFGGRQVGREGDARRLPHVLELPAGDPHHEVGVDEVEQLGRGGRGAVHGDGGEERLGLPLGGGAQRAALQRAAAGQVGAQVLGGRGEAAQVGVRGQVDAVGAELGERAFGPLGAGRHLRHAGPDERAALGERVPEGAGGEVGGVPAARVPVQAEVVQRGGDDGGVAVQAGEEGGVAVAEAPGQVRLGALGAFGGGDLRLDQGADVGGARQRARVDVALRRAGLAFGALLREEDDQFGGL